MATGHFMSRSNFRKKVESQVKVSGDIKPWIELPIDGTIYKIASFEQKDGKFGICTILSIIDKLGQKTKVWAPRALVREIEAEERKEQPREIYFTSLGQSKKDGRTYNNYDSCYQ